MKIVFILTMIVTAVICSFTSLFACLEGEFALGALSCVLAVLVGLVTLAHARDADEPVPDACIPAEWASEGVLEAGMILSKIHPADWQLEEIMTIRLAAYLDRTWKQLHDEWGYGEAGEESYRDGLLHGFAMATRQAASHFKIKLEKL